MSASFTPVSTGAGRPNQVQLLHAVLLPGADQVHKAFIQHFRLADLLNLEEAVRPNQGLRNMLRDISDTIEPGVKCENTRTLPQHHQYRRPPFPTCHNPGSLEVKGRDLVLCQGARAEHGERYICTRCIFYERTIHEFEEVYQSQLLCHTCSIEYRVLHPNNRKFDSQMPAATNSNPRHPLDCVCATRHDPHDFSDKMIVQKMGQGVNLDCSEIATDAAIMEVGQGHHFCRCRLEHKALALCSDCHTSYLGDYCRENAVHRDMQYPGRRTGATFDTSEEFQQDVAICPCAKSSSNNDAEKPAPNQSPIANPVLLCMMCGMEDIGLDLDSTGRLTRRALVPYALLPIGHGGPVTGRSF